VIVASGGPASAFAPSRYRNNPIVFVSGTDPVKSGLVAASTAPAVHHRRDLFAATLAAKRLELLHELVPMPHDPGSGKPDNPNSEPSWLNSRRGAYDRAVTCRPESQLGE